MCVTEGSTTEDQPATCALDVKFVWAFAHQTRLSLCTKNGTATRINGVAVPYESGEYYCASTSIV